jgi:hypothetical protein
LANLSTRIPWKPERNKRRIPAGERKKLWAKSGNRCAFPKCKAILTEVENEENKIAGEEAHIVALNDGGPRGDPIFPIKKRNLEENLILFCSKHHKIIDDDPESWTVEKLRQMKSYIYCWQRQPDLLWENV